MLRQLALDRRLRRKVTKAMMKKRKAKSRNETQMSSISVLIEDYGDDSWTSADSEDDFEDKLGTEDSEQFRNSRVDYMKTMGTNTGDKDMAERFQTMKKVRICLVQPHLTDCIYIRLKMVTVYRRPKLCESQTGIT